MTGHQRSQDAEPPAQAPIRLDSWKAIADFLGRSVRTVRRWERTLGLPVRRLPGAQRHSVFAFSHQIDAWLKHTRPADRPDDVAQDATESIDASGPDESRAVVSETRSWTVWYVLGALTASVAALTLFSARSASSSVGAIVVAADSRGVTALIGDRPAWTWPYPTVSGAKASGFERDLGSKAMVTQFADGRWEVTAVTPSAEIEATREWIGSDLVRLASDGRERWRLTPSDTFVFDTKTFGKPWQLAHLAIEPRGDQRMATAWRHMVWWPSVLKIIGADINNAVDAGMMVVVDPDRGDATAPSVERPEFTCENCASGRPVLYAAFPRSEVNLVSGSPFNTAGVTQQPGQILIRTLEVPDPQAGAEGVYQFSETLELKRATYGERYWDVHRRLEAEGKLTHSGASCPDRDGPREVRLWTAGEGWRSIAPPR